MSEGLDGLFPKDDPECSYALGNQKQIDILASYLGEVAEHFEFSTDKHRLRAIYLRKGYGIEGKLKNTWIYLDLMNWGEEDSTKPVYVRLYMQVAAECINIGEWLLADPNGMSEVRKYAFNAFNIVATKDRRLEVK